jgi:ADP-heptose:LPS heptosyltransferase
MLGQINKTKSYNNLIMSWSCFGDFVLISQSMKTLIDADIIKRGIIITHQKELKNLLDPNEKIVLLYPTQNIKDFFRLFSLIFKRNIFVLHDMPSHNRFSKEIRLIMSIALTITRPSSKMLLMLDEQFKANITTKISKEIASRTILFDKRNKIHISQYMLDLLFEAKIISKIICEYKIKLNEKFYDISSFGDYIAVNPFASSDDKSMSVDWYIEFINKFEKISDKKIVLLGSKKDKERAEEIVQNTKNVINLCGETSFAEVLYILKNSYAMINVDSGPTHYGAIYEKPQIILWGENKNFAYMPVHNKNAIFIFGKQILKSKDVYESEINFTKYADVDTILETCKSLNF